MIGFLNIYKPSGMTSNAVVQKIKKKFHIDKIGHMGTLDPMACGILPLAIGKATRLFDYSLEKTKKYNVIFDFGFETDSLDITGNITKENCYIPSIEEIKNILPQITCSYEQVPPNFSAKNINGKRAYELARNGEEFELKPKLITIYDLKLIEPLDNKRFRFEVTCSSGTYIRALGRDIAKLLNTCATMCFLERISSGNFDIETSVKLEDILKVETLENYIISPLSVFKNFDIINIDEKTYIDLKNGKKIPHTEIKNNSFVLYQNSLIGVSKPSIDTLKLNTYLEE